MSRSFAFAAPVVAATLALSFVAGCGATPNHPASATTRVASQSVKMEAAARKETRAAAQKRAKGYIAEFQSKSWRSINARTEMVEKIARTDSDAAYDFLLQEIDDLQELRGEMKNVSAAEAEEYEETLTSELDEMTPDQAAVKKRVAKAESLKLDLDEATVTEERTAVAAGVVEAMWGGQARVGSRNRLLSAIQESKLYKACKKAYKNTRKKVKSFLSNLCRKLRWC